MSEKTEQPTPKKLRDAREKGQVAKSKEIPSAATLIGMLSLLFVFWPWFEQNFRDMLTLPAEYYGVPFAEALPEVLHGVGIQVIKLSLPPVAIACFLAIAADYTQVGALFSIEPIKPDMKKINPAEGVKKIFSMNSVIELLKSIVKISVLAIFITIVLRDAIDPLLKLPFLGLGGVQSMIGLLLMKIAGLTILAFLFVAAADYFLQKHQHIKKLKMTKDEVKREHKQSEGDPHIKGKRKQLHKEMVMENSGQATKKADVVVTNPTHFAVALKFDIDKDPLPIILAKGTDAIAQRMKAVARDEEIPIMENVPLARALYARGRTDDYIPRDLIEPVAEVLRWVNQQAQDVQGGA